jgi:transcriptional regulator with GAF, ATPase, and Fis domain
MRRERLPGRTEARQGLFEAAHGGTLFLDEAGEMSPAAQAKLLRVLVDGQVQRVGSTQTRTVDVRVLAATHRNLEERVQQGLFRQDLYYRLAVVPIHIPALRDRKEDLPGLCEVLSTQIARELKVRSKVVSQEALHKISQYPFPGNIRELRNLLERAHILSRGEAIVASDLPIDISRLAKPQKAMGVREWIETLPTSVDLRELITLFERGLLERAMEQANGVQAEAARMLGLSRSDMGYKVAKYAICA